MTKLPLPYPLPIGLLLAALMTATRSHHFASTLHLPDASWAGFFLAGAPLPGVFAAGEVMAGNILGRGYLAGFGMTIGSVFGRIAGREAVKYALN